MRKIVAMVTLGSMLFASGHTLRASDQDNTTFRASVRHPQSASAFLLTAQQPPRNIEHLSGAAALAHLNNLKAKRARAFAAAIKDMHKRGFRPTDIVNVVRSTSLARDRRSATGAPAYHRTQTVGDASGELVMWAWDDGNDSTWEGVIYVEDYVNGINVTWDSQIDVATSDPTPVWEYEVAASNSAGTDLLMVRDRARRRPPAQVAAADGSVAFASAASAQNGDVQLVRLPRPVKEWLACTVAGCGSAALGCLYGGPSWGHCFALWCGGSALGCGLGIAIMYLF